MDRFENFNIENNTEKRNRMQVMLAQRFYGQHSGETMTQWIDNYAKQFNEIVSDNPDYINTFDNNPEEVLEEIEKKLYDIQTQEG